MAKDIHPHPGPFKDWYKPTGNSRWEFILRKLYRIEWLSEVLLHAYSRWALIGVLSIIGAFFGGWSYHEQRGHEERTAAKEEEETTRVGPYQSLTNAFSFPWRIWTMIHAVQEQKVSGLIIAMEELARDGVSMSGLKLPIGADLSEADLFQAILSGVDLTQANLSYANLSFANLSGANLTRADLSAADLFRADLRKANINAILWQEHDEIKEIRSIRSANIWGIKKEVDPSSWTVV